MGKTAAEVVDPDLFDQGRQEQRNDHCRYIPLLEGAERKANGQNEKEHAPPRQIFPALGVVNQQGAAAAQIKEKNMQPLKIMKGWGGKMMEKSAGQGCGHHNQEHTLKFPTHYYTATAWPLSLNCPRRWRRACSRFAWRKVKPDCCNLSVATRHPPSNTSEAIWP